MIVHVNVQLGPDDKLDKTHEQIGKAVLKALGESDKTAACMVMVTQPNPGPVHVGLQFDATGNMLTAPGEG